MTGAALPSHYIPVHIRVSSGNGHWGWPILKFCKQQLIKYALLLVVLSSVFVRDLRPKSMGTQLAAFVLHWRVARTAGHTASQTNHAANVADEK